MHLIADNIQVTLEDNIIDRSPYLRTLRDTSIGLDMSEDNIVKINAVSIREFNSYITFLETGKITGIEGLYKTCDYMGHDDIPKDHGYTNGYYEAILLDWWNSMYNRELTMVMQYLDIDSLTELDKIFGSKEYCIVGEYVNDVYYGRKEYPNIDVYLSDRTCLDNATDYCKTNNYSCTVREDIVDIYGTFGAVHITLKEHSSPYSILEDIDLDCLCCLIKDRKIYCNARGSYSLKYKINNFNPDKYSSTYCDRLLKYNSMGIRYFLPGLDRNLVYDKYIEECIKNYHFINPSHEVPWLDTTVDVKLLGHYCDITKDVSSYIRRTYDTVDILLICYVYGIRYEQENNETSVQYRIQLKSMQDFYLLTRF